VLTSLVKVFIDFAYAFCWVGAGLWLPSSSPTDDNACGKEGYIFNKVVAPLLSVLPLWFRLLQNLRRYRETQQRHPFLSNAGKYALAQVVALFGMFQADSTFMWVFFYTCASLYAFWWDVRMDWALGQLQHQGLRDRLMFHNRYFYYSVIVIDFILRFAWSLTLMPQGGFISNKSLFMEYFYPFVAAVELTRRCMWSWLRLEKQHVDNTERFRRVDFVPLHFDQHKEQKKTKRHHCRGGWLELFLFLLTVVVVSVLVSISPEDL